MSVLQQIIRKAHCRKTYQYFAIDAIPLVQTAAGKRLASWLLRHYRRYLQGTVDPDTRFCDYQNQVIHADQGYWGGAPRVAHQWYDRLQSHLRQGEFYDAAHAAGVLSHYFTDPMEPLHTAYSSREAIVHRPLEWSVSRSYDSIRSIWLRDPLRNVYQLPDGPGWLGAAMINSARMANRRFDMLVNSYQLDAAVKNPQQGLTAPIRVALAELFGLAITGWARVIERAAYDYESTTQTQLPTARSVMPYFFSTTCAPLACWRRRVEVCIEDTSIKSLVKEYRKRGELEKHLPAEVDIKRRVMEVHRNEEAYRQKQQDKVQAQDLGLKETLGIERVEARYLRSIGVENLRDLITNHPGYLAEQIKVYWIDEQKIEFWQRQASLICDLPGLETHASRMLAGAGFSSGVQVAKTPRNELIARVKEYANSSQGKRALHGNDTPTIQDITAWLQPTLPGGRQVA